MLSRDGNYDDRMLEAIESIAEDLSLLIEKFGGVETDSLNVTLYTDKPIQVTNKEGEK